MMSDVVMVKSLHAGARYAKGIGHTLALAMIPVLIVFGVWSVSDTWSSFLSNESKALWSNALPYLVAISLVLPVSCVRRALNGVVIFNHKESILHTGMWLKTITIVAVLFGSYAVKLSSIPSAILALMTGITIETIYLCIKARKVEVKQERSGTISLQAWMKEISPFALMSFVSLGIGAIVTTALSFGPNPELAVAIFSLLNGLLTIIKHAPMSIQSIWVDALNKDHETNKMKTFFVFILAITIMAMCLYYAFFHDAYIYQFNGITTNATGAATWTFVLLSLSVLLTFPVIYYRGKLICENKKSILNISTLLEFSIFIMVTVVLIVTTQINSAVACSIAIALGRLSVAMMMKLSLAAIAKPVAIGS